MRKIIPLVALALSIAYAQEPDPNLHIYIAYGQSNMSGQGEVTAADKTPDSRFLVLRAANHSNQTVGEFYPAAPPMGHSQSKVGIVDVFGRTMVKNLPDSITVAVANIAIGGQSIDLFDKDRNTAYVQNAKNKNDTWWIQYLDEYGGDLYKRIIEMGEIAKKKGVIKGFLFHQGEADYQMSDWPKRVKKVYDDIIAELGLDPIKVPILIGELATTAAGGDLGWRNSAVAEAADLIPNGHLISAEGCPALKEASYTLHFTREGYDMFGARYAEKMLEILKKEQEAEMAAKAYEDSVKAAAQDSISKEPRDTNGAQVDSLAPAIPPSDTAMAIFAGRKSLNSLSESPRLVYDRKEQKLFIRMRKNGVVKRYEVTGKR